MTKDELHIKSFIDNMSPMIRDLQDISRKQLDDIKLLVCNALDRECRDIRYLEELADSLLDVAFVLPEAKQPFFELLDYIRPFDAECANDYEKFFNDHIESE